MVSRGVGNDGGGSDGGAFMNAVVEASEKDSVDDAADDGDGGVCDRGEATCIVPSYSAVPLSCVEYQR